jgi:FKBP-type peptidyl-prolyl cis-trans isomerase
MHRRLGLVSLGLTLSLATVACPQKKEEAATTDSSTASDAATAPAAAADTSGLANDDEKTIYALGLALARNIEPFHLSETEVKLLEDGLRDGALGRPPKVPLEQWAPNLQKLAQSRAAVAASDELKATEPFLAEAAAAPGAQKRESGVIYREETAGTGAAPKPTDVVKVHYHGTLRDGSVFDSSRERGEPAQFPLNRVIPCWTEAIQKMKVGGKAVLICPAASAYGDRGAPPKIKPGAALKFEVELIEVVAQEAAQVAPAPAQPEGADARAAATDKKPAPAKKK